MNYYREGPELSFLPTWSHFSLHITTLGRQLMGLRGKATCLSPPSYKVAESGMKPVGWPEPTCSSVTPLLTSLPADETVIPRYLLETVASLSVSRPASPIK